MTVESVFVRAQLKGEPLQKLLYIWVLKMLITHVFSAVSEADWDGAISKWSAAKPASPALIAKAVVATGAAVLKTLVHMLVGKLPSFQVWIFGLVPSSPGRNSLSEHSEFVGEGKESVHGLCLQFNPRLRLGAGCISGGSSWRNLLCSSSLGADDVAPALSGKRWFREDSNMRHPLPKCRKRMLSTAIPLWRTGKGANCVTMCKLPLVHRAEYWLLTTITGLSCLQRSRNSTKATFFCTKILLSGCRTESYVARTQVAGHDILFRWVNLYSPTLVSSFSSLQCAECVDYEPVFWGPRFSVRASGTQTLVGSSCRVRCIVCSAVAAFVGSWSCVGKRVCSRILVVVRSYCRCVWDRGRCTFAL